MTGRRGRAESELGDNYVFRYDPVSDALSIATDLVEGPNGLAFSRDERILCVTDTSAALGRSDGNHHSRLRGGRRPKA
ncbi:MAG: hypothetical protein ABSG37_07210 [Candidatus Limnocylindrales bacterium]